MRVTWSAISRLAYKRCLMFLAFINTMVPRVLRRSCRPPVQVDRAARSKTSVRCDAGFAIEQSPLTTVRRPKNTGNMEDTVEAI